MPLSLWIDFTILALAIVALVLHWRRIGTGAEHQRPPPPRCSHCHLTLSNASARYCPRCGADRQPDGMAKAYRFGQAMMEQQSATELRDERDMWRERAFDNLEALRKSADLASAAVRQLPETVYIYPSADFSTIDHCK